MNSKEIIEILFEHTNTKSHRFQIQNIYLFRWECDFFSINPTTELCTEFEVKISRSDFKADFQKEEKHRWLSSHKNNFFLRRHGVWIEYNDRGLSNRITFEKRDESIPNRFYYVAPIGIIPKELVPKYAGLIEIDENKNVIFSKKAPTLHKEKFSMWKYLCEKFYWQQFNSKLKSNQ